MKNINKALSIVLSVIMILSIIPLTASAATYSGTCGDNVFWELDTTGTLTIFGEGAMYDYVSFDDDPPWYKYTKIIEQIVLERGITQIGECAFEYCINIESIHIPDSVIKIGCSAFSQCSNLKDIHIPDSVIEIGDEAFYGCDLRGVILTVEKIGSYAFAYCNSLSVAVFADGVKTIGERAFYKCENLSRITFGESVEYCGYHAFYNCHPKADIFVNEEVMRDWHPFNFATKGYNVTIHYPGTEEQFWENIPVKPTIFQPQTATVYFNSHIHKWDYETTNCTCIESGYVKLTCETCGEKDEFIIAEPTDQHQYIQKVTTVTCTNPGYIEYTCDSCGVCRTEYFEATGHKFTDTQVEASCTAHGYTKYTCEHCGDSYTDYTSNPTGHTLNEDGVCEVCGEKEVSASHINTQMLSIESVFAMIMNLLAKLFGIFSVT